jgi:hypothetical protein
MPSAASYDSIPGSWQLHACTKCKPPPTQSSALCIKQPPLLSLHLAPFLLQRTAGPCTPAHQHHRAVHIHTSAPQGRVHPHISTAGPCTPTHQHHRAVHTHTSAPQGRVHPHISTAGPCTPPHQHHSAAYTHTPAPQGRVHPHISTTGPCTLTHQHHDMLTTAKEGRKSP